MNEDDRKPASIEDIKAISPERWAELEAQCAEAERYREFLNLVPLNQGGERYIRERYPIALLYARADLQEMAESDFDTVLTETEIQTVHEEFFCEYPDELHLAIADAIERVVERRSQSDKP
jgi:hypothetical protein